MCFNHGEKSNEILPINASFWFIWVKNWMRYQNHSFWCVSDLIEIFLEPWRSIESDFTPNPSIWSVSVLLNWKFSSIMVKNKLDFTHKFFILVWLSAPIMKKFSSTFFGELRYFLGQLMKYYSQSHIFSALKPQYHIFNVYAF